MSIHSDADPLYSQVVLLLNNNGSTITDDSLYGRSYSVLGGAVTTATQKKFGGKSLQRPSGNPLRYAASTDFTLGTGDFTVEFFRYLTSATPTTYQVARANGASANRWALGESGTNKLAWWYLGSAIVASPSNSPTGSWQHCAYSRSGGTGYLCADGAVVASIADTNNYADTSDLSLFGDQSGGALSDGGVYLDFIRITLGAGRYTGSYTVPEAASDRMRLLVSAPMQTVALIGNGNFSLSAPMQALSLYTGAQSAMTAPTQTLAAVLGGAVAEMTAPSSTVSFIMEDVTGDNAINVMAPSPTVVMRGGMVAVGTAPSPTVSAAMTVTSMMTAEVSAPSPTVSVTGTVSAMLQAALSGPSPTVSSFTGARVVMTAPVGSVQASGAAGGVATVTATCPMFDLTATMAAQAHAQFALTAPSPVMSAQSIKAALTGPSPSLVFTGYAVVAATYEAFATNLKHTGLRPGQTEIDEVTRYTNFPFTHIIRFGNSYFGVGSLGLYLLGGTTDYASPTPTPVAWAIKTGATDFGRQEHKTIDSVIFGGRMPAEATITMYAGEAAGTAYAYTTPRGALAQNYRMKPGKGLVSRYYAFGASGAGTFFLDTLTPDVAVLKRRI